MKLAVIVIAASVGLASAGGLMLYKASRLSIDDQNLDLIRPHHYITQQMEVETAALAHVTEPVFTAQSENGKTILLDSPKATRPQFVLFIKDDCPCSIDAQPLFNRLADRYKGKVDFYGVIDGDQAVAKKFASLYLAEFPVIPDSSYAVIRGFQAKGGIYCALVARNGHLIKMWPGYSAALLQEMNHYLAAASGVKETKFDPQYAPKQKAAGCAYESIWK